MNIQVFPDAEAMAQAAVAQITKASEEALATNEPFSIAFSGGSTPRRTYELLAKAPIDWGSVEAYWVDERQVPPSDPNSNEKLVRDCLLSRVKSLWDAHPMVTAGTAAESAANYGSILVEPMTYGHRIDLAIMGIGPDGHTASLFPGIPELDEKDKWVVPTFSPAGVRERITLTIPALAQIGQLLFLVEGEGKREALRRIIEREQPLLPAARVDDASSNSTWLVAQDAMPG